MRSHPMFRAAPFAALVAALALPASAGEFDALVPAGAPTFADATGIPAPLPDSGDAISIPASPEAVQAPATPAFGTAVPMQRLDTMRGGDGNVTTTTNRADLRGNVGGNSATNVIGGGNGIADGSFGNAAGISTVIQNSGSNVLIQNSTIVNVQFVPTP